MPVVLSVHHYSRLYLQPRVRIRAAVQRPSCWQIAREPQRAIHRPYSLTVSLSGTSFVADTGAKGHDTADMFLELAVRTGDLRSIGTRLRSWLQHVRYTCDLNTVTWVASAAIS